MADPVAEVLAEHQRVMHADWGWVCSCGHRPGGTLTRDQFAAIAAHQADALRAKGLVPETVAWVYGVQYGPGDAFYTCPSRESALSELAMRRDLANPGQLPYLRLVRTPVYPNKSPWRTADEGSES